MSTLKTQGTRLYFASPASASSSDADGVVIMYVTCPTGIQGLGGAADQIDTTCLDATERTFVQGLLSPGQITVPFNLDPTAASHQELMLLRDAGTVISWMVVFSDAVTAGTVPTSVDSDDRLVSAGSTTAEFLGYVADVTIDIQTNEIVRGSLVVQRSGAVVWDWP